jgi:hypothetical protein
VETRTDIVILAVALFVTAILFSKRVRTSRSWIATVTPLASIIGSGFLVVVPLLGRAEGLWAAPSMLGIVCVAYALGAVIRHNIRHVEPRLVGSAAAPLLAAVERLSSLTLILAYLISVTFYLRLLSAFLLEGLGIDGSVAERLLTSAILATIGAVGLARGLGGLERLEEYSVSAKLALICSLLVGLALYDIAGAMQHLADVRPGIDASPWEQFRILAGMLLVVQGFETSRYLGETYDRETRIRTMRVAQWISGCVYVVFVVLALPLIPDLPNRLDETAIIQLSARVASILPPMLVIAAVMSQFSAAVADTVGGGGLISDAARGHVPQRWSYVGIAAGALALNWLTDIFEVIAFASRAFALYYLLQCVSAFAVTHSRWRRLAFSLLAGLLALVVVFAVPAA